MRCELGRGSEFSIKLLARRNRNLESYIRIDRSISPVILGSCHRSLPIICAAIRHSGAHGAFGTHAENPADTLVCSALDRRIISARLRLTEKKQYFRKYFLFRFRSLFGLAIFPLLIVLFVICSYFTIRASGNESSDKMRTFALARLTRQSGHNLLKLKLICFVSHFGSAIESSIRLKSCNWWSILAPHFSTMYLLLRFDAKMPPFFSIHFRHSFDSAQMPRNGFASLHQLPSACTACISYSSREYY